MSFKSVSRPGSGSRDGAGAIKGVIFSSDTDALKKVLQQKEGKQMCFLSSHVLQRLGTQSQASLISARMATNQEVEASFHILKLISVPNVQINSAKAVAGLLFFYIKMSVFSLAVVSSQASKCDGNITKVQN